PTIEILDDGLIAGMNVVGVRFRNHDMFLPEVLLSARAMTAGVALLKPLMIAENVSSRGKVVLGSVQGDLHDIGKNLVVMMLKGSGFSVDDLGVDCDAQKFVDAAKGGVQVIAMSALLTTTMPAMKDVIDSLQSAGVSVKTMIGGAPITQGYADEIRADGYAPDAASAVDTAKELIAAVG
ncbi:corrinoid protein, partial [bacterium]|nr:corrinoid protein [bacterium]